MILVIGIYKKKNMVIQMNKINITLPIIKINIDYSIRSKEKSGLFEYTILDIYNNIRKLLSE